MATLCMLERSTSGKTSYACLPFELGSSATGTQDSTFLLFKPPIVYNSTRDVDRPSVGFSSCVQWIMLPLNSSGQLCFQFLGIYIQKWIDEAWASFMFEGNTVALYSGCTIL